MPALAIEFPYGTTVTGIEVTDVGPNLYRLDEEPMLIAESDEEMDALPRYGDVIRTIPVNSTLIRFDGIHERARLKRWDLCIGQAIYTSSACGKRTNVR